MPRGDRTGPMGMGPRTGRGAGYCVGAGVPGYANPVSGRGFGFGAGSGRGFGGGGRGWRHRFYATGLPGWMRYGGYETPDPNFIPVREDEILKNRADFLQSELNTIHKRLDEIAKKTTE